MEPHKGLYRYSLPAGLELGPLDQKASSKHIELLRLLQAYKKMYKRTDKCAFFSVVLVKTWPQALGTEPLKHIRCMLYVCFGAPLCLRQFVMADITADVQRHSAAFIDHLF